MRLGNGNFLRNYITHLAQAISVTPIRGSRIPALPPEIETVNPTLEEARDNVCCDFLMMYTDGFPFPVRLQNPLNHALRQYITAMKNHATIHFEKRFKKYIYFKGKH